MNFEVRATRDLGWLQKRTEAWLTSAARGIECVDRAGRTVGMLAYDQWTANSCMVSVALETPAAWQRLLRPAFAYPFEEAGKGVLLCGISSQNPRSLALVRHLGFRQLCRIADQIAVGIDLILFGMRREDCRWLKGV